MDASSATFWVNVFQASLAPVIAVFGGYIAWQQWNVNRANLRERLFERRMEVFNGTQAFLSDILSTAKVRDESLTEFTLVCQKARFLFGKKIQTYLLDIRSRSIEMRMYQIKMNALPAGDGRSKLVDQEHDRLVWLTDQLPLIFDKFEPFMGFEKHK
jgi:hypothetical protein